MQKQSETKEQITGASLIRLPEVKRRVSLSRSTIYQMASRGEFPKPVSIGLRAVAWSEASIDAWVRTKIGATRNEGEAA